MSAVRAQSPTSMQQRLAALAAGLSIAGAAPAGNVALTATRGTDISVAARESEVVIDLAGRLWRIPAGGGAAVTLTPPGEFARRPAFSPDGTRLAWQSLRNGVFQIVVADASGAGARAVTNGAWNHIAPAWAPDGSRIAFSSDRGGDLSVWEIALDTGELTQLSFEPGAEIDPAWERSGRSLAYVSEQVGRSALVLRTAFRPPRELLAGQTVRAPSWRPDGSVITYSADGQQGRRLQMVILSDPPVVKPVSRTETVLRAPVAWLDRQRFVYAADGMVRQREFGALSSTEIPFTATFEVPVSPARQKRILAPGSSAVRGVAGLAVLPNRHLVVAALGDLWELETDGALIRALTRDAFMDRDPTVSPDGRWLAFTSDRGGTAQIWMLDLGTGDLERLTAEPGSAGHASWSGGGDRLAYIAGREPRPLGGILKTLALATRETVELAPVPPGAGTPAWSPGDLDLALVRQEQGSARLLLYPAGGGSPRRVTLPNDAVGAGFAEPRWSSDGKALLLASPSGIRALPVLDSGLVGADWRVVTDAPARFPRWIPGEDAVMFVEPDGLGRATAGDEVQRIALPLTRQPALAAGRIVIRGARVFDSLNGGYLPGHAVVIDGARIVAVRPEAEVIPERGELVIDAKGKTVVPGLIDLALRIGDVAGERLGRTLLAYGITTAQASAEPGSSLRELAELWETHGHGPRLLQSPEWCGGAVTLEGDPAIGAVRLCAGAAGGMVPPDLAPLPLWAPSWLGALAGHAQAIGLPTETDLAYDAILGNGELYQDAIDVILHSTAMVLAGPGAGALAPLLGRHPGLMNGVQAVAFGVGVKPAEPQSSLPHRQRLLGRIAAGGGHLAAASDSPAVPYGLGLHVALRQLADAGVGRAQALLAATSVAAAALGLQGELGSVAAGHQADLLIVEGDPLANLDDLLRIDSVIAAGRVHTLAELTAMSALEKFTEAPRPPTRKPANKRH